MLYKINLKKNELNPIEFHDFSSFGKNEKELENLIANNILTTLFEDASLMPIFQERKLQSEADIYALNEEGDLVIFELKRGSASNDAVHQVLRYSQEAGQWSYLELQSRYHKYTKSDKDLAEMHKEAFELEEKLLTKDFNRKQKLIVIGSAADEYLVTSIDYWKKIGINIDFLPYRLFTINNETFFEFFSLPYDIHANPINVKGVIFDTNRSYNENAIWCMFKNKTIEAYGDAMKNVQYININDLIFYSHKWVGIVAAAKVKNNKLLIPNEDTYAKEVEFLTPLPNDIASLKAMPFSKVSQVTKKSFFWARTIKVPYLTKEESDKLLKELIKYLN